MTDTFVLTSSKKLFKYNCIPDLIGTIIILFLAFMTFFDPLGTGTITFGRSLFALLTCCAAWFVFTSSAWALFTYHQVKVEEKKLTIKNAFFPFLRKEIALDRFGGCELGAPNIIYRQLHSPSKFRSLAFFDKSGHLVGQVLCMDMSEESLLNLMAWINNEYKSF